MATASPILLIDFSALFRRAWHVQDAGVSHAFEATIAGVNRASGMLQDALVAICCDGRGNWRKELSPAYKANRESQPAALYGEMDRTLNRLRRDGRLIWKFDGFEADDVIASAVMMACTRGHWCRIVSHDKDLLQLLSPACDYLAIHKTPWEVATAEVVREKYGIEPEQLGDWLALVGDTSDNVKGCPGVGAKTATILLQAHGTLENLFAGVGNEVEEMTGVTPNVRKNLTAWFTAPSDGLPSPAHIARSLVSLSREVPIKFDEIYEVREQQPIDERDHMDEAEQDADKYFGNELPKKEKAEVSVGPALLPETAGHRESATQPEGASRTLETLPAATPVRDKTPEECRAIAIRPEEPISVIPYELRLEPTSFREAMIYASAMHNSKVYSRYPTQESIVAAVVRGREMGYGCGASLDIFHVADFNNDGNLRLMLHAHLIIDRVMRDPLLEYFFFVGGDETQATYKAKVRRNPETQTFTYTIQDAERAGLVKLTKWNKPNNWMRIPKEQLRKTAGVQFGRVVAPGAALGLYCMEEMGIDE